MVMYLIIAYYIAQEQNLGQIRYFVNNKFFLFSMTVPVFYFPWEI